MSLLKTKKALKRSGQLVPLMMIPSYRELDLFLNSSLPSRLLKRKSRNTMNMGNRHPRTKRTIAKKEENQEEGESKSNFKNEVKNLQRKS